MQLNISPVEQYDFEPDCKLPFKIAINSRDLCYALANYDCVDEMMLKGILPHWDDASIGNKVDWMTEYQRLGDPPAEQRFLFYFRTVDAAEAFKLQLAALVAQPEYFNRRERAAREKQTLEQLFNEWHALRARAVPWVSDPGACFTALEQSLRSSLEQYCWIKRVDGLTQVCKD